MQNEFGIQNNKLNTNMSFHVEKVQLLYDSNHFHSQYITICVFFLQLRGKSRREVATACAPPTAWLSLKSHWAVCNKLWWWAFAVQLLLCQLCNLHVSNSVMFVYTFNSYMYSFHYALSHSIDWHLLEVVCNILNMQRCATSVAGQTCSYSGKAAKGGSQYLCLNGNVSLLRHS